MKIVIFGATGTVGRLVTDQALASGGEVTAFSRGGKCWLDGHDRLRVAAGDVLDPEAVRRAVAGQDAVICVLGNGMKGNLRAPGTANIIAAMQAEGVRRLVVQSTLGAGDSRRNLNFWWRRVMFGMLLRRALRDHERQEALVRASGLDWTIVRPSAFADDPAAGRYRQGFGPEVRGLALRIPRADVAAFLLGELKRASYMRRTVGISE